MHGFSAGLIAGATLAFALVFLLLLRKQSLLQNMDFRLTMPAVPVEVLHTVKQAERRYYRDLPAPRRFIEASQDIVALLWPQLAFALNVSVGAYRIKPQTIRSLVGFALQEGYLQMHTPRDDRYDALLAYFAMQPALNDWQAGLLLQQLKMQHPAMQHRSWQEIAANPGLIAKLYSGYMGAGGDWDAWLRTTEPGAVSKHRLGYDPNTGAYALIVHPTALDRTGGISS